MNFVTGLPISADWKGDSYDSILVIVVELNYVVYVYNLIIHLPELAS